jgi:PPOX class probable F420-dependent enzyme
VATPGTDDAAARADCLLRTERVVWLSTVCPDGRPHLVPIWFWWDGMSLLIASKPNARKIANLRAHPECMLAIGDAEADFDVALIEARAELTPIPTGALLEAGLLDKYHDKMAGIGLSPTEFAATYSQVIRIAPIRCLRWHGRTPRSSPVVSQAMTRAAGLGVPSALPSTIPTASTLTPA